jgi:hypothetical protein
MVCYKNQAIDPVQGPTTTVQWRDPIVNRPEQSLMGVQFSADHSADDPNAPFVVSKFLAPEASCGVGAWIIQALPIRASNA